MKPDDLEQAENGEQSENVSARDEKNLYLSSSSYAAKFVKRVLFEAVEKKASDIFIEPMENNLRVRYRIDGLLCKGMEANLQYSPSIISCFKITSNLDIAEHRFPQDGRFRIIINNNPVDFRASVMPTNRGEKVVLRVLDKGNVKLDLDLLGFDQESRTILRKNLDKPYGMILVCGPTGSGKTTTLYACVNYVDSPDLNIMSIEDPIEFRLKGINQVAVCENIGLTFASILRSTLRQDPDIIMIGEIRDSETADIAIKASLTGHLVLSTIHTTSATGAIVRFINMGIEPFLMASSCLMTASQVLLRKLCENCRQQIKTPVNVEKIFDQHKIGLPDSFKYYRSIGCRFCNKSGFSGRVGIIEVLELDAVIRKLLIHKENEATIRKIAIEQGMKTLREKALGKVLDGITTVEEVYRVTL